MMTTMTDTTYNGWKNYETWNVALWIGNDEGLYSIARQIAGDGNGYSTFAEYMREMGDTETPDGVAWNDSGLDIFELDAMLFGLVG
jgi:hypothetical protein